MPEYLTHIIATDCRGGGPVSAQSTRVLCHGPRRIAPAMRALPALLIAVIVAFVVHAGSSLAEPPAAPPASTKAKTFADPEAAVEALVDAARANDEKALLRVLGVDARRLISSGDAVADNAERERFVTSYQESHSLVPDGDSALVLQVGKDGWPFPIPVVRDGSGWRFDTKAGQRELLARRIGGNELSAIQACLALVDAQREYWERSRENSPLSHYARRISSTKDQRDGLYWETSEGERPSPLGPQFAEAQRQGYNVTGGPGKPIPYHGYYYRILTAQGPDAAGGAYNYLARGQMIGGFALIAYPAQWGASGIMAFIVNHDGVVYQKNLGPNTAALAEAMKAFNPDSTWTKV